MNTATPNTITIDVTNDLEVLSDLKKFFVGEKPAVFEIGSEISHFAGQPIESVIRSNPAKLVLQGDHRWQLPQGISFSLNADASCTVGVSNTSTKFAFQKSPGSNDTADLFAGPVEALVYVNIDLDFDIQGSLSGSGSVGGFGIAGKSSGAATTTLSYCHPVSSTLETMAAIKSAFNALSFPLKPDCALGMAVGSVGKVSFSGSVNVALDLSYGFPSYKFSARNPVLAAAGIQLGPEKLKPPKISIDSGAEASISYKHSDNFTVIVTKSDATTAMVHFLRSADDEVGESVGVTVGLTATSVSAKLDTQKLAQAVTNQVNVTPPGLANAIASGVSGLQDSLVSSTNQFLSTHEDDVGLMFSLSQQRGRTLLFHFKVDLLVAGGNLAQRSWMAMAKGDLGDALKIGGFTLLEDSGVAQSLKRSSAIDLHFFSFHLGKESDFFENSVVRLTRDGSICFFADQGEEAKYTFSHKTTTETIHFVATAGEQNWGASLKEVDIDLAIDLSETGNPAEANRIANTVLAIPASPVAQSAHRAMLDYAVSHNGKALTLTGIFKSRAYGKLTCSAFTKDAHGRAIAPSLPQELDRQNWEAFQVEVKRLIPDLATLVSDLTYSNWMDWNVYINFQVGDKADESHVPNRRSHGNDLEAAKRLFGDDKGRRYYAFLEASTGFMNLCDDLHSLTIKTSDAEQNWADLLGTLQKWIKSDTDPDWSKPALGALLRLCSRDSDFQISSRLRRASDGSGFSCTLTVS